MLNETIGSKVRIARKSLGLTQSQLGKKTGLHHITISKIERGTVYPAPKTAKKLFKALKNGEAKEVKETKSSSNLLLRSAQLAITAIIVGFFGYIGVFLSSRFIGIL